MTAVPFSYHSRRGSTESGGAIPRQSTQIRHMAAGESAMNWDAIGAMAELVGAAGVIFSLVYLARQIRQSNVTDQLTATLSLQSSYNEVGVLFLRDGERLRPSGS
jgi:hypothetical protein